MRSDSALVASDLGMASVNDASTCGWGSGCRSQVPPARRRPVAAPCAGGRRSAGAWRFRPALRGGDLRHRRLGGPGLAGNPLRAGGRVGLTGRRCPARATCSGTAGSWHALRAPWVGLGVLEPRRVVLGGLRERLRALLRPSWCRVVIGPRPSSALWLNTVLGWDGTRWLDRGACGPGRVLHSATATLAWWLAMTAGTSGRVGVARTRRGRYGREIRAGTPVFRDQVRHADPAGVLHRTTSTAGGSVVGILARYRGGRTVPTGIAGAGLVRHSFSFPASDQDDCHVQFVAGDSVHTGPAQHPESPCAGDSTDGCCF
jgi:hypothetical protein